ncbi:MAG: TolC family protein, partial [Gemmatimonadota bacterium]
EAGVQMSWELDAFGRLRRSLEGRSALVDAAREDVRDTRMLLAAEVADAYFRLRGDQDRLAVARRNAANQRQTLDLTIERLEGGQGTAVDSERARAQLSTTLAAIPALESSMAASRHRIAVLVGREPGAHIEALEAAVTPVELPEELVIPDADSLVRKRPDVLGAERRLAASAAFVDAARAEYLPRVTIVGGAGYTAGAFDDLGDSGTLRYAIGPVISWPLFDLGRVKAGVDAAESEESVAQRRYQGAVLRALEEVETSLVAYHRARERLEYLEDAAVASERATELARLRFAGGATDFLEVLDAERTQLENQDRLSGGRTEATTALVAVFRALGGAWPEGTGGSP